jgi:iron(III) transport system permease protein
MALASPTETVAPRPAGLLGRVSRARAALPRFTAGEWLLLAPVLVGTVAVVGLLAFVFWLSFNEIRAGVPSNVYSLRNYVALAQDPLAARALSNTLGFTVISLLVAVGFGLPLAWLVERTDLPGKAAIWTALSFGLLIPGFMTAMGWLFLLHPRIGLVNSLLMHGLGLAEAPLPITTVVGMGWVQGLGLAPLFFVMTAAAFRAMDPALEEAALMSGASFGQTWRRVVFPLLLPGILAAVVYMSTIGLGAFDVPAIIGLSSRIFTFSTFLFFKANPMEGSPDYGLPAAFGACAIVLALLLSWAYSRVLRRARQYEVVTGKAYRPRLVALKGWSVLAWAFVGGYLLLAQIVPFLLVVWAALLPYMQPLSPAALPLLSLDNFGKAPWELVARGAQNTVVLALLVPTLVAALSLAFAWVVLRSRLPGRLVFDTVAFLPHAVPGIIFAIGAVFLALFALRGVVPLYGSLALFVLVYTVGWLSFGTRVLNSSLIQIHRELEEAGQMAGADHLATLRRILLPLLRPALLSVWIWVALLCFRELTMAVLLFSPASVTLPLVIWNLWLSGQLNQAAAITLAVVGCLVPLILLYFHLGRRAGTAIQR